jgi:hypothetical protein
VIRTATPARPTPIDPARALDELDSAVKDLITENERLIVAVADQRAAISLADGQRLNAAILRQGESAQRIAQIERRRIAAVTALAGPSKAGSRSQPGQIRLTELAATLPEPGRARILQSAGLLRAVLEQLHREYAILREAAGQLAAHLEGITRQVYAKLSHTGAYARSGSLRAPVQVVSLLDVRT